MMLPASGAMWEDASSSAGQAEPNEMLWYGVIDRLCQTEAGTHRGLSSIHYAND